MHFIQVKTYSSIHVNVEHKNCMTGKLPLAGRSWTVPEMCACSSAAPSLKFKSAVDLTGIQMIT